MSIEDKAREWIELNRTDYDGYADPLDEDYQPVELPRFGKDAYLAGYQAAQVHIWHEAANRGTGPEINDVTQFEPFIELKVLKRIIFGE